MGSHRCIGFCYGGRSCAMAIGIKAAGGVSGLAPDVQEALRQAGDSRCALQQVADPSIAKVVAVGIAFLGKSCVVAAKALKGGWDGQSEAGWALCTQSHRDNGWRLVQSALSTWLRHL